MQALAQALQSHIQVYSAGLPVVELGEEYKGGLGCCNGAAPWGMHAVLDVLQIEAFLLLF